MQGGSMLGPYTQSMLGLFTPKGRIQQTEKISVPGEATAEITLKTCLFSSLTLDEIIFFICH